MYFKKLKISLINFHKRNLEKILTIHKLPSLKHKLSEILPLIHPVEQQVDDQYPTMCFLCRLCKKIDQTYYPLPLTLLWYPITIAHAWTWPKCFSLKHSFMRCIFTWKPDKVSWDSPPQGLLIDFLWYGQCEMWDAVLTLFCINQV